MLKKLVLLLCLAAISPTPAYSAENYDPLNTMAALNMAVISINRIINTQDRITLYQEYTNIINNLAVANIESDYEMMELWTGIMNFISSKTLRQDEEKLFRERYNRIQQRQFANAGVKVVVNTGNALLKTAANLYLKYRVGEVIEQNAALQKTGLLWNIAGAFLGRSVTWGWSLCKDYFVGQSVLGVLTNSTAAGSVISIGLSIAQGIFSYMGSSSQIDAELNTQRFLLEQQRINSTVQFLGGCSTTLMSAYFDHQNHKDELMDAIDAKMWQLSQEDIQACNELQTRLLNASWNLMRRYHLPEEYRIVQSDIEHFYKAVDEPSPEARMRMFKNLEDKFRIYPPYWFYRGQTARALNNKRETLYCLEKFDEVRRPVLRQDIYMAEATKYRISEIVSVPNFYRLPELKTALVNQLDTLVKNIPQSDWQNYNFAGLGYYAAGNLDKARHCIANNIDFGFEHEVSQILLDRMKAGEIDINGLNSELEDVCLSNIIAEVDDKETAWLAACYFRGDYEGVNASLRNIAKPEKNPAVLEVMYLTIRQNTRSIEYHEVFDRLMEKTAGWFDEKVNADTEKFYSSIAPVMQFYLERGSDNAKIFAGWRYYYGLGTGRDIKKAYEFFAVPDNFYAEYIAGPCCQEEGYYKAARKYFSMSAESGDFAPALYELGEMFSQGKGTPKDYAQASGYFLKAAKQGHELSQARLGDLYYEGGNGLKQSYYNAYVWYQVYSFDDGEERFFANAAKNTTANVWRLGGWLMWDETPAERIKLIEGYGWLNLPKLGDVYRQQARKEAQGIKDDIAARQKFLLVQDNSMTVSEKVAVGTLASVVLFALMLLL